jgi:acetoin utilization deacetylase AcuC-like enzyme
MKKTGFVYSPVYLKHNTGNHPENPSRLTAILYWIEKERLRERLININPYYATLEHISWVHDKEYIGYVERICNSFADRNKSDNMINGPPSPTMNLAADTVISADSFEVSLLSAGGVLSGIDKIFKGEVNNVFCAVRPPGHHAENDRAMGFCIFNNIAIGAKYAQKKYGVKKVFILDWDVHHGNGTQNAFYDDPAVFYASIHQQHLYPGTGASDETGSGDGRGFTINFPIPSGQGDREYITIFKEKIYPFIISYKPELLMLSSGFDAHLSDPLGGMNVTSKGFGEFTEIICSAVDEVCQGRLVSVLEGGYNLEALGESVVFHIKSLMGL